MSDESQLVRLPFIALCAWGYAGLLLYGLALAIVCDYLGPDIGLGKALAAGVAALGVPEQGHFRYMVEINYIALGLLGIFASALLCNVIWLRLLFKCKRIESRTRRRLCAACAYPIGTRQVCTECGKALV